jgi:hypothetical protein
MDSKIQVAFSLRIEKENKSDSMELSLGEIFTYCRPPLFGRISEDEARQRLSSAIRARRSKEESVNVYGSSLQAVAYALQRLGLIRVQVEVEEVEEMNYLRVLQPGSGRMVKAAISYWSATNLGQEILAKQLLPENVLGTIEAVAESLEEGSA